MTTEYLNNFTGSLRRFIGPFWDDLDTYMIYLIGVEGSWCGNRVGNWNTAQGRSTSSSFNLMMEKRFVFFPDEYGAGNT